MRRRKCLSEEKLPQSHLPLCSSSPSASHPHRTESSIGAAHPCGCRVEVSTKYNRDLYSWMLHHHFFFRPFQLLLAPLRLNESDISRRFVRKTFCQDRLRRFVRRTFCQDQLRRFVRTDLCDIFLGGPA